MAVTYTTAQKVANTARLLDRDTGARLTLSTTTDPTLSEVEDIIYQLEDSIEARTNHAWRERAVTAEIHDYLPGPTGYFNRECSIPLNHRSIKTLAHASGDKLEIFTTTGWVDMLADPTTYAEDRLSGAFWVDYQVGFIYLKPAVIRSVLNDRSVRVTYRYGETAVPKDIERAVTLIAAAQIVRTDVYKIALPEGPPFVNVREQMAQGFEKEANKILMARLEIGRAGF